MTCRWGSRALMAGMLALAGLSVGCGSGIGDQPGSGLEGETVIRGRLLTADGRPLADRPVDVYRFEPRFHVFYDVDLRDAAVPFETVRSAADGRFELRLRPADKQAPEADAAGFVLEVSEPDGRGRAAWTDVLVPGPGETERELPDLRQWPDGSLEADPQRGRVHFGVPAVPGGAVGPVELVVGDGDWVAEVADDGRGADLPLEALLPGRRVEWQLFAADPVFQRRSARLAAELTTPYRQVAGIRVCNADGRPAPALTDGRSRFDFAAAWPESVSPAFVLELPEAVDLAALVLRDVRAERGDRLVIDTSLDGQGWQSWETLEVQAELDRVYLRLVAPDGRPCRQVRIRLDDHGHGSVLGIGELSALVRD